MKQSSISYASPKIAKDLVKVFGDSTSAVRVTMRTAKDVPQFIRKVESAQKKAAKSRLRFG